MLRRGGIALVLMAGLTACAQDAVQDRPQPKPEQLATQLVAAGQQGGKARPVLTTARVSTKTGEIMILEPDGSISTMTLDSQRGRAAMMATESVALNPELLDMLDNRTVSSLPRVRMPAGKSLQEQKIEAFNKRSGPALPRFPAGYVADADSFIATRVTPIPREGAGSELIEVVANLRAGVDDRTAFAYATCALAGWAKANGSPYARHVRTLKDTRNGKLLVDSAFTLSRTRPMGLQVMETETTLRECESRGIPAA